ncbi:MAG: phosphoribosylanthranilate isomerase [Chloroherpetonaceae bacterium]|nr:phosphoribosylanthranilate isomerase [Chloroherpetonaceae bacterium]MDW8436908.1 phosphoribosylanthranilate isomerase [Chloroherpetonaceae bacterium]
MVKVKICGITNLDDALAAADFGADALGFNFYERSLRYISPRKAKKIIDKLPSFVQTVGVFVDDTPKEINEICDYAGIATAQLHDEKMSLKDTLKVVPRVVKTFRVHSKFQVSEVKWFYEKTGVNTFLFDAYHEKMLGGTGKQIQIELAKKLASSVEKFGYVVIAGGLNEDNVQKVIKAVKPYAIDVASGVESDIGKKDHKKLKRFIERAKTEAN